MNLLFAVGSILFLESPGGGDQGSGGGGHKHDHNHKKRKKRKGGGGGGGRNCMYTYLAHWKKGRWEGLCVC